MNWWYIAGMVGWFLVVFLLSTVLSYILTIRTARYYRKLYRQ